MTKRYCLIILVLAFGNAIGQNLIPNGDFEQYSACPTSYGQIDSALFWMNPTSFPGPGGSPDYFNECASSALISIPNNSFGYQLAHSGQAYCGLSLIYYDYPNFREYVEIQLSNPLVADSFYRFEMYISKGEVSQYACNSFGVYFSDTVITGINHRNTLPFVPQIANVPGNYVSDTSNWILFTSTYKAHGGENYLLIGNFKDDANSSTILTSSWANYNSAYIYIDDVSLIPVPGYIQPCPPMSFIFSVTDATFGMNDGAVKIIVFGGESPYLYSLDGTTFQSSSTFVELNPGIYQVFVKDLNECLTQGIFNINQLVGIKANHINDIKVFPNPFSHELFIEFDKEISINLKLIDVLGKEILFYEYQNNSIIKLNVSQIPAGIYYLQILNSKGEKLHTTMLQRKAGE